jgi:hypothetical protein
MRQTKGGITGDRPLALNDLGDAVRWNGKPAGELSRRDSDLLQFIAKNLTGVDGGAHLG